MAEYLSLYDARGADTGFVHLRDGNVCPGAYYLVVNVFSRDEAGHFLVTRRSPQKEYFPLCWEVTGGCVQAGESSDRGARRELWEETGLLPRELLYLGRCSAPTLTGGGFFLVDVYEAHIEGRAPAVAMQEDEVCEYRWVSPRTLRDMVGRTPMEPLTPLAWRAFEGRFLGQKENGGKK